MDENGGGRIRRGEGNGERGSEHLTREKKGKEERKAKKRHDMIRKTSKDLKFGIYFGAKYFFF